MSTRNLHSQSPAPGSYSDDFLKRLDGIETQMKSVGMSMNDLCRRAGVSRCTPDRWRRVIPKTIRIVTEMEAVLAEEKAKRAPAMK